MNVGKKLYDFLTVIWYWCVLSSLLPVGTGMVWLFSFGGFDFLGVVHSGLYLTVETIVIIASFYISFNAVYSEEKKHQEYTIYQS